VEPESQVAKNAEPASSEGQIADTEPQVTQLPTEPTERSPGSAEPSGTGARANEWRLIKWIAHGAERSVVPDSIVSIAFDPSGKISGNASVNRYSGTFSFDVDGHLKWPPSGFRVTRMAGDPALMAQERAFLDSLRRTSLYKTDGQQLILESANASVVLTFTR
jgi:heat shock protein HslJ